MPVHDWTRVDDGVFHDVHVGWIVELRRVLNGGLLPSDFYAMSEQVLGGGNPDVLTLEQPPMQDTGLPHSESGGGTALLTAPPRTRVVVRAKREAYTAHQRRLVIRHRSGHRVVALIELLSGGNKASDYAWSSFVNNDNDALHSGIHLLLVDVHPPTLRVPKGVHSAIWESLTGEAYDPPAGLDRTLVSYAAGVVKTAYVEPISVGQQLRDMPLFLRHFSLKLHQNADAV